MKRLQFDSIRLSLIMVVLLGALPVLVMILLSGRELREQEVQIARKPIMAHGIMQGVKTAYSLDEPPRPLISCARPIC